MKPVHLRVLSYNIHKGFNAGKEFTLEGIREAIELVHADLVLLQEVQGAHSAHKKKVRNYKESQFEFLADRLWPHFAYGKNAVYAKGHHGNALLSKFPLTFWENINISTNRFEKRGMLHAIAEIPQLKGLHVHAICVHLDLLHGGRVQQLKKLIQRIQAVVPFDAPLVIGGDFNDWRETATEILHDELGVSEAFKTRFGEHARTFPVWFPFLRLDRIYLRGVKVRDAKCMTGQPWTSLSDHAGLFADLEIGGP
ncbi:MAG: endonuclease/exonuclease/phosphatase family protein [Bdellovibrionia bacterium]